MLRVLILALIAFALVCFLGKFISRFIRHTEGHRGHQEGQKIKDTDIAAYILKRETWNRDQWKCVRCGSTENLEYDHVNSVSRRGSNTAGKIELLCKKCIGEKYANR